MALHLTITPTFLFALIMGILVILTVLGIIILSLTRPSGGTIPSDSFRSAGDTERNLIVHHNRGLGIAHHAHLPTRHDHTMDRLSPHSPNTGTKPQTFGRARPNRALGGHGAAGRLGLGLGRPLQLRVSSDSLENEEFIREGEEGVNHSGGKEEIRHRRDGTTESMTSTTRSQQLQGTNIASEYEDPSGDFQRQLRTHSRYPHSTTSITLSPSNPLTFQLGGNYGTRGTPIFVQVMVTPPSPAQRYDVDSRNSLLD